MSHNSRIQLTQTVQKGGCAAKVAAKELREILKCVKMPPLPKELLVGTGTFDDAAVYKVNDKIAMVQTLDFFTPIVDTPKIFGKIAATNALSDVYAMGGEPKTALGIFAFPLATMEREVATDILQGASEAIEESGASLVGGHTIDDDTLKFGLSVTGFVHPERIWSNDRARPGDELILTKGIGTGTLTAALKRKEVSEDGIKDGLQSMMQLNRILDLLSDEMRENIHAVTDVTGFGVAGHSYNMALASDVSLKISLKDIPVFEKTMDFIEKGFLTKAHRTNWEYVVDSVKPFEGSDLYKKLICDPQTSGGLLISIPKRFSQELIEALKTRFPLVKRIGEVLEKKKHLLEFY